MSVYTTTYGPLYTAGTFALPAGPGVITGRTALSRVPLADPAGVLMPAATGVLVLNSGGTIFRLKNTDTADALVAFVTDMKLSCADGHGTIFPSDPGTLTALHAPYPVPASSTVWLGKHQLRDFGLRHDGYIWIVPNTNLIMVTAFEP
jgi:hypothetical protein